MPANPPYLPAQDVALKDWAVNFSTLITATPANYNLVAGDATAIDAVVDAYVAALVLTTNPATRTPVTIAAKDAAREAMKEVVMPYATGISQDAGVSDGLKTGVGVTVRSLVRTRNSVVDVLLTLTLLYKGENLFWVEARNPATPLKKSRPIGALGFEVQIRLIAAPQTMLYNATLTKPQNPVALPEVAAAAFDTYEMRGRWVGASLSGGAPNVGPWTAWTPISF